MNHLFCTEVSQENEIKVNIRWMSRKDMKEVLKIENECFEFAWTEKEFMSNLWQRNCVGWVAEYQGRIIGFMVYKNLKNKIHLLNIATLSEFRRQGVGTQLVAKLITKLGNQRRRIMLEVRETNLPAQLFLRFIGFRAIEILRDFYDETNEDAYQMVYKYQELESLQQTLQPIRVSEDNRRMTADIRHQ